MGERIDDPSGPLPGGYLPYLDEHADLRVALPEPVCDFCLSPEPAWEYPAGRLAIEGHPLITDSDDEWLACVPCAELVDAHDIGALVERAVKLQRVHVPDGSVRHGGMAVYPPLAIARRHMRENVVRFFAARTGPARRWTDG